MLVLVLYRRFPAAVLYILYRYRAALGMFIFIFILRFIEPVISVLLIQDRTPGTAGSEEAN